MNKDQPKTPADRKRAERARKAEQGLFEVRGIYADSAEKAEKIKKYAARLK